ncbi:MAG: restriction endonuclease subunit S [Spirobacillus cienkowskii]|jgi:type I restriction enzyme S subunit|uniref:Restriction endonuclease subunit S n=1 Tax=Spirobacillus cienkowskii TaxID=495820 RepID=A0A369KVN2_9BACT|nr:MAG: restriction endonuclease subunit S [Spirobacillus cienkowskii]
MNLTDWNDRMKLSQVVVKVNTGADAIKRAPIVEENTGIKCLRIGDVSQKKKFSQWGFTKVTNDVYEKFQLKTGDIIIARTGNTIGVNTYIESELPAVFNNGLIRIKVDDKKVIPRYFYYIMQTEKFKNHINSICFGTSTQPNMQIDDLLLYETEIPSLRIQNEAVNILKSIDDKIDLNNQMNETLESMAKAIFKEWFIDFGPVRAKAEGRRPFGMDNETAALFPDSFEDSELGPIPKGWRVKTLGEVVNCFDSKRIPLSSSEREKRKGIFPYYGASSLMGYVDDFIFDGVHILMGEDGSVINQDGSPVLQYVWGKFWVNNHAHVLTAKDISNEHLFLFLKHTVVTPFITGAVQPKLNQGNMNRILFIKALPEIDAIFSKNIESLFAQIRSNRDENIYLCELRDLLLPKLISGEISLSNKEKEISPTSNETTTHIPVQQKIYAYAKNEEKLNV